MTCRQSKTWTLEISPPTRPHSSNDSATENPKADASEKAAEQSSESTLELTGPDKNSPEKKETTGVAKLSKQLNRSPG